MSLKAFHVFFVLLATALCGMCALWAAREYMNEHATEMLVFSILSALSGVGILIYGGWFIRKQKHLSYL
ncbi:MAG: hypothetical protein IT449_02835 [Phycisphaerales bacterium]|nr:hypothetical protein [Phycisphaerales bacterium]